ncbi:unnamed protein product [Brassicogethes aeneus]|uniref:Uncharacterized protein n=1 Tax=Brassicogethes aeneus TaxID=1431903 RepID=A0A9P0FM34_BRAAE|nr:unnamed protein product [Brassicogethes aeneus]
MEQVTEKSSTLINLENSNRKLLKNQSFLYDENKKLYSNLEKFAQELEDLKRSSIATDQYQSLRSEKSLLILQNKQLKSKLKQIKAPSKTNSHETVTTKQETLHGAFDGLDQILGRIKGDQHRIQINNQPVEISDTLKELTRQLELEQKKTLALNEQLRQERNDDEKGTLKTKLIDMKDKITNLEVENTKLIFQNDQLTDDLNRTKKQLERSEADLSVEIKKSHDFEKEKDKLKRSISEVENDNLRLKKEMIEELNEANRAKRISIDTEIALQHISEAYENKRKEAMKYIAEIDELKKSLSLNKK